MREILKAKQPHAVAVTQRKQQSLKSIKFNVLYFHKKNINIKKLIISNYNQTNKKFHRP